jgi:hypothetical protein
MEAEKKNMTKQVRRPLLVLVSLALGFWVAVSLNAETEIGFACDPTREGQEILYTPDPTLSHYASEEDAVQAHAEARTAMGLPRTSEIRKLQLPERTYALLSDEEPSKAQAFIEVARMRDGTVAVVRVVTCDEDYPIFGD